jgi:Ca2+-binding EF-hand superfamily protein
MANNEIEELLNKLREKRIKKKISVYDLFRKLDKVGSGFITHESWLKNISDIITFTEDEKENVFNYMDRNRNRVIDYKTFLSIINNSGDTGQS